MNRKIWFFAIFIAIVFGVGNVYAMSGDFILEGSNGSVMSFTGARRDGHATRQTGTVTVTARDDHGRTHTSTGTFFSTNHENGTGSLTISFTSGFLNGRQASYSVQRTGRWVIHGHGERWVRR